MASKLFVRKSIAIEATPDKVWRVLTEAYFTEQWVNRFGLPGGRLISDWLRGHSVTWLDRNGATRLEGRVVEVEPESRLHFTVIDRQHAMPASEEDGITYHLISTEDGTELTIEQGDFSKIPNGAKYHAATNEIWDQVTMIIKDLAEKL